MSRESRGVPDALYRNVSLAHQTTLPVLGHPVRFETNCNAILEIIDDAFGHWRQVDARFVSAEAAFHVRLVLHEGSEAESPPEFRYRLPFSDRLIVATKGSFGLADVGSRVAFGYVTKDLVASTDAMRIGFLEALTLMLTTSVDRCALHAAAVTDERRLLLLMGRSGSGKSSLAYVAHRTGYRVLSDDTVFVQLDPECRIWSASHAIHLMPTSAQTFTELGAHVPQLQPNGKAKMVVPLPASMRLVDPWVGETIVCVLELGSSRAELSAIRSEMVHAAVDQETETGFDLQAATRRHVVQRLARNGGWQLCLSDDAHEAVPLIRELFG